MPIPKRDDYPSPTPLATRAAWAARPGAPPLPPVLDGAVGRTRALYSNWLWCKGLKLLVDAGDGCALALGKQVGSPAVLALTHGHADHLLGLPNLLGSRQFGSMTSGGPLTVVHPAGCPAVAALQAFLRGLWPTVAFDRITWRPTAPGDRIPLAPGRTLVPFATRHVAYLPTQGYVVLEARRRLTAAARTLPPAALQAARRAAGPGGRGAFEEMVEHPIFAHTGDTMPIDSPLLEGADVLVHDASFLDPADRDYPSHATVAEACALAAARGVRTLVLHHVSQRYPRAGLAAQLAAVVDDAFRALGRTEVADRPAVLWWDEATLQPLSGAGDGVGAPA